MSTSRETKQERAARYCDNREKALLQAKEYQAANKDRIARYQAAYRKAHRDERSVYDKTRWQNDKEAILARHSAWLSSPSGIQWTKRYRQAYALANRDKICGYMRRWKRARYAASLAYRIECVLRRRIQIAIRKSGGDKDSRTLELVGCSVEELLKHLEGLWKPGMSWENYGLRGWHIDHIRPCASFDLTDPEQQKACFHWSNLQPLWAEENIRKSDKWEAA